MDKSKFVPEETLLLHNRRMLQVMRYVIFNRIEGIDSETKFIVRIANVTKRNNLHLIYKGKQSFVAADMQMCCTIFGIDGNFLLVESHLNMLRPGVQFTPYEQLLAAVHAAGISMGAVDRKKPESEGDKLRRSIKIIEAAEQQKKDN